MKDLTKNEIEHVCGAKKSASDAAKKIGTAAGAGTATFTGPDVISSAAEKYAGWGQKLSQTYWDYKYPYDPNKHVGCYGPGCKKKPWDPAY